MALSDKATAGAEPKSIFAYPLCLSENHWTLVLVDRAKGTIEYYDSKCNYTDKYRDAEGKTYQRDIDKHFQEFAKTLGAKEDRPYTFERKIAKELQPDSDNCGPWVLYFLENRLATPNVDFNTLGTRGASLPNMENLSHGNGRKSY